MLEICIEIEKMIKVCIMTKFDFLGNKTVKTFFLVQMFNSPMDYLASIMF